MRKFIKNHKAALIFTVFLFYLYFRGIGDHGLIDNVEGVNSSVAVHMLAGGNYFTPKIGESLTAGSTMGTWWLMALALKIFGWGEFSVRFWQALSGLGMILISAMLACSDENSRGRAWLASSMCAGTAVCFIVSQIASSHAIFAFLMSLALLGIINSKEEKEWLMISHASIAFAFIIHGLSGIFMPFIAVAAYCVVCDDMELLKDFFTWPFGIIINLALSGLYVTSLIMVNPQVLFFMVCRNHIYTFGGVLGTIIFIFVAFAPFHGFLLQALIEIFPRKYPAEKNSELLMFIWALTFICLAIFSGDVLLISASAPALCAILGIRFDFWLRGKMLPVRYAVLMNILILVPMFYVFLPFVAKYFPVISGSLMSLIPYEITLGIFIFASWYYTRTKQIEKWVRNVPIAALICLMPAAGVFSLTSDLYSIRDIALKMRDVIQGSDIVIQYEINHPSVYFYTFRNSVLVNSPLTPGVEEKKLISDKAIISNLWIRRDRVFLVIPSDKISEAELPNKNVNPIHEINGILLLSNKN